MKNLINSIGWIMALVLFILLSKSCREEKQTKELVMSTNAKLDIYQDREQRWHGERTVIIGNVNQLKGLIESKDSTIAKLATKVDRKSISHTRVVTENTGQTEIPIVQVIRNDSIPCDTNPIYHYMTHQQWIDFDITASRNKAQVNYKTFHELNVDVKWKREKWYKSPVSTINVFDNNPNNKVINVQSLSVQKTPNRIGFLLGVGLGVLGVFTIQHF